MNPYPFVAATVRGPLANTVTLPAFSIAHTWTGVGQKLTEYQLGNTGPVAFQLPLIPPTGNYEIVVKWTSGATVYRRKFTTRVPEFSYDVYAGDTILAGAVIEIWSTNSTTPAAMATDFTWSLSTFVDPGDSSYCSTAAPTNTRLA